MNLFKNDYKHDYECQVKENAVKQEKIHNLNVKLENLDSKYKELQEELEKQHQANKILQAKIEQANKDYEKLLEKVGKKNDKNR